MVLVRLASLLRLVVASILQTWPAICRGAMHGIARLGGQPYVEVSSLHGKAVGSAHVFHLAHRVGASQVWVDMPEYPLLEGSGSKLTEYVRLLKGIGSPGTN